MSGTRFGEIVRRLVAWRDEFASPKQEAVDRADVTLLCRQANDAIACLKFCERHGIHPGAKAIRLPDPSTLSPSSEYRIVEDHETEDRLYWSELAIDDDPVRPSPGSLLIDGVDIRTSSYDQGRRRDGGAPEPATAIVEGPPRMTAEEFARLPESDSFEELVRGAVVRSPLPNRSHGLACSRIADELRHYLEHHPIGRVFLRSGIVTRRAPDSVRGADVSYYSFNGLPANADLVSCGPEVPELVVEVLCLNDRWIHTVARVAEYLEVGVPIVVVLDPIGRCAWVFYVDAGFRTLGPGDVCGWSRSCRASR